VDSLVRQLKQVVRRLWRAPMFTCITLVTLAVGIGANTAVFSVLEGVLLKPLPYPRPNQLVGVWHSAPGLGMEDVDMAPSNYFIYREQNRTFQDIGLYQGDSVSITGVSQPEQVRALDVTDGTLPLLGVPPLLGRWFTGSDATPGSPDTVILTYGYWQRKFGSDRSIAGRTITVDGKPRQIIGVMPKNFQFLDWEEPALILPLQFDRDKTTLGQFSYEGIGRLKPGMSLAEANTDVARMIPAVWARFPTPPGFSIDLFKRARLSPNVQPLKQDVVGDVGQLLWILMGSIGTVLLIACANAANLLLVRAEGRQQELAIRAALGASRGRIGGELLLESMVIGLFGGALGLALAYGALRILVALAPAGLPRVDEIDINVPVLVFTLIASLLASLFSGLIPVLRYAGARLGTGLREGGRALSQGRERHRTRNTLVVAQVGLGFCAACLLGIDGAHLSRLDSCRSRIFRSPKSSNFSLDDTRGRSRRQRKSCSHAGRGHEEDSGHPRCLFGRAYQFRPYGWGSLGRSCVCTGPELCRRANACAASVQVCLARTLSNFGDSPGRGTRFHLDRNLRQSSRYHRLREFCTGVLA